MPRVLRIVKFLVPNGRKTSSVRKFNTNRHQERCPAGSCYISVLLPGGEVRIWRCRFGNCGNTLCGSDAMKMYVIAQLREYGGRDQGRHRPQGNTNTYLGGLGEMGEGRKVSWRQGKNNQKYARNVQSYVLQNQSSKGGNDQPHISIKSTCEMRLRSILHCNID